MEKEEVHKQLETVGCCRVWRSKTTIEMMAMHGAPTKGEVIRNKCRVLPDAERNGGRTSEPESRELQTKRETKATTMKAMPAMEMDKIACTMKVLDSNAMSDEGGANPQVYQPAAW